MPETLSPWPVVKNGNKDHPIKTFTCCGRVATPSLSMAKADETAHRLMTSPGIGPVTAVALTALAPPAQTFRRGRDFAAWVGLTPLQHSTGGKQKLGATSKMGERTLRRLLIIGASAVLRWAARHGAPAGSGTARMLACKPPMLVRVALANKMARIVWALMANTKSLKG